MVKIFFAYVAIWSALSGAVRSGDQLAREDPKHCTRLATGACLVEGNDPALCRSLAEQTCKWLQLTSTLR